MGYYIQTTSNHDKAAAIALAHGGTIVSKYGAEQAMNDPTKGVICVVDNGMFEAAAFAYDHDEFAAFTRPTDRRPIMFVVLDRKVAEKLSDYPLDKRVQS